MSEALAAGVGRFSLSTLSEEPWRNGGGITRTVLRRELGGTTLWRISVADITGDGPFSRFEGMQREAVLIDGSGVLLQALGETLAAREIGDRLDFPGEWLLHAELVRAAGKKPFARLWNVMSDRARAFSTVRVSQAGSEDFEPPGAGALLVLEGVADVLVDGQTRATLHQGDGLLFDAPAVRMALRWHGEASRWLLTTLRQR